MRRRGLVLLCLVVSPARALAYRPFDQTDADVAGPKEIEIELGPVGFLHERGQSELTPGLVLNLGLARRLEGVIEGRAAIGLGSLSAGEERGTFEPALLLKCVLREGSLQERSGPSVAAEAGLLLPALPGLAGTGGSLALIASQRWREATLHVNAMAERTRDDQVDLAAGAIVEGPPEWRLRPVAEFWLERAGDEGTTSSALGGAIWRAREGLSFDGAVRVVPMPDRPAFEVRLGLTWTLSGS